MTNLATLVLLPRPETVNQGLSLLREQTMLELIGVPGNVPSPGKHCGRITNSKLNDMLDKRNIGNLQFSTRGPGVVLDVLEEIFDDILQADPELFDKCRTNGSLCCRRISGGGRRGRWSNHAWGMAIDLGFQPETSGGFIPADPRGDDRTELGLLKLVPFFNRRGWFWGGTFSGRSEDSMHFEVSEQLARRLFSGGGPIILGPRPPRPDPTAIELKHHLLASDAGMLQVAVGHLFLRSSGARTETVGVLQDALNSLRKAAFKVALGPGKRHRGFYGRKTETAVRNFQTAEGLDDDGVVGAGTLGALDTRLLEVTGQGDLSHVLLRTDPILQAVAAGERVLQASGVRVSEVGLLQDALNMLGPEDPSLAIDLGQGKRFRGFYGSKTTNAVKHFQESNGIDPDGRVGEETIKAIDKALQALPTDRAPDPEGNSIIEGPGGYLPPIGAREILGAVALKEAEEINAEDVGIHRDQSEIILRLQSGALFFEAGMQTDADGSPRARTIDTFGQLETSFNFPNQSGQKRFVDAESVNYIVLPDARLNSSERFFKKMGCVLGDVAAVIREGHLEFAMFADVGPFGKLGEGSVRLVQALGVDPFIDGIVRVGIDSDVVYIVFPGSRPSNLTPENAMEKVNEVGRRLFSELGGRIPPL